MQAINIDVTKIDKTAIYHGAKGKYLSIILHENKPGHDDKYGNDGFVTQDIGKERREAGEKGAILGNWKYIGQNPKPAPQPGPLAAMDDQLDDIPF